MFVVITLGAQRAERGDTGLLGTFVTPTLVHFGVVFLIALLALSPESEHLVMPFGLIGIIGLIYGLNIAVKTARLGRLFSDALLFHAGIPLVCYAGIVTAAWLSAHSMKQAYLALGAVSTLLLLAGMRNAWAVAIDVARRRLT